MGTIKDELLKHLKSGKRVEEFPGIKPVTSLDKIEIRDDIIKKPNDITVKLIEKVVIVTPAQENRGNYINILSNKQYQLRYSLSEGGLIFEEVSKLNLENTIDIMEVEAGMIFQYRPS